jgi:hypothetical protein
MKTFARPLVVATLLLATWLFGDYVYPYFARAELYAFFFVIMLGVFVGLEGKLGRGWTLVGVMGVVVLAVLFLLTSPHRLERVRVWLDILS